MNKTHVALFAGFFLVGSAFAASKPPIPSPEPNFTDPGTPEERKAYKIAVLENEIVQDQYIIGNPGGGKQLEVSQRTKIAEKDLKNNRLVLENIKNGKDMEVYFCSKCGREYMKKGTCPHCQVALVPLFPTGKGNSLRPSTVLETD